MSRGICQVATQNKFITPATNKRDIKNQQQPRQYRPCFSLMVSAPSGPSRHSVRMKPIGVRQ